MIKILGGISAAAILALMLLTTCDVVLRYLLGAPIKGAYEISEVFFLSAVFLGLSYTQVFGEHVRVDLIISRLPANAARIVEVLILFLALLMYGLFAWAGAKAFWASFATGEYRWGLISIPLWPAKFMIPLGVGVLCFRFISEIVTKVRQIFAKESA